VHRRSGERSRAARLKFPQLAVAAPLSFWTGVACLVLVSLFGGDVAERGWQINLIIASGIVALCAALSQGAAQQLRDLPLAVKLLLAAVITVPIIQIVPLPPAVWHLFPGRSLEREVYDAVGLSAHWLTISIEPLNTAMTVLLLPPVLATFLLALRATRAELFILLLVVCALVLGATLTGVIQYISSGAALDFHAKAFRGPLLGYFTNRNHMALYLAAGILAGSAIVRWVMGRTAQAALIAAIWSFLLMCVIIGTASRAGFALGCLATLIGVGQLIRIGRRNVLRVGSITLGVGAIGALALSWSGVFARLVERFAQTDADARWSVWNHSLVIARDYFPVGVGFATFDNVYRKYEQLDWVSTVFMNHAHQEYIEIVMEAGILGVALILLLANVWATSMMFAWRLRDQGSEMREARIAAIVGGDIVLLFALHSLVDYPIRTPALAVLFALSLGLLVQPRLERRISAD
jgi:O-antigen ligase